MFQCWCVGRDCQLIPLLVGSSTPPSGIGYNVVQYGGHCILTVNNCDVLLGLGDP